MDWRQRSLGLARALLLFALAWSVLLPHHPAPAHAQAASPGIEGPFVGYAGASGRSEPARTLALEEATAADGVVVDTNPRLLIGPPVPLPFGKPRLPDPLVTLDTHRSGAERTPGLTISFGGISNTAGGPVPPDTIGDVGPHHYVQMVNTRFAVFDKTGGVLMGPLNVNTLFSALGAGSPCSSRNDGDPVVVYDGLADRWLLSQFAVPDGVSGFHVCIAISQTPDPTGSYFLYDFPVPEFPDYFKIGVWPDGYYMATNEGAPGTVGVFALDRGRMLQGLPAPSFIRFVVSGRNVLLPSDVDGRRPPPAGAPNYFYTFTDGSFPSWGGGADRLDLFAFHADFATPASATFTALPSIAITPFNYTVCGYFVLSCITQPAPGETVDPVSEWPMWRFAYRNLAGHEALVGNFTVDVTGTPPHQAGIRWFELRKSGAGGWTLFQEGTHAPDGHHRWMGSIAMDASGNIALGYSAASASLPPSLRYATRLAGAAPGTLETEAVLIAGTGVQTNGAHRWGDYSAISVDPSDDCTFWYTGQYYPATSSSGWATRIGAFKIPSCQSTFAASGMVATAGGTGVSTVSLHFTRVSATGALPDAVDTGADGRWTQAGFDVGSTYRVTPSRSGYTFTPASRDFDAAASSGLDFTASPGADLVIGALDEPPATVQPGGTFTLNDTTTNQGLAGAPGFSAATVTAYYLSTDAVISSADVRIGSRLVPTLLGGSSSAGGAGVTIPLTTPPGLYFVGACADDTAVSPESNEANNCRSSTTRIAVVAPDLTIAKTHAGSFRHGQVGATYTITVTNAGTAATAGTVTVTDTLPSGLTATALAGSGWSCTLATLTCTRGDALAGGASYPAITLTVTVATTAPTSVVNTAAVSGGNDVNTTNNSASDPTTVLAPPDLTIAKTHAGSFARGQIGKAYTITVTNAGAGPTAGTVTVTDTLPPSLTASALAGPGWSCTLATLTCTRADALASSTSYSAITLTVNVAVDAPGSVTNTATVSGGGDVDPGNNVAADATTISPFTDVSATDPFGIWIEALFNAGITGGCAVDPPRYCPELPVTRAQMAVFLVRGIHGAGFGPPAATGAMFADVPAGHPLAAWIEQLARDGITGGCSIAPSLYCPDQVVTRGQMAVFLVRATHGTAFAPPDATGVFADVAVDHPFAAWIEQLARDGITGGCGVNPARYCPADPVTRGQMAVFLVRAFALPL